jgi:ribosomal protein S18 acetylase RimI-like enzyme
VGTVAVRAPGAAASEAWLPNACDLRHLAFDPAVQGRGLSRPLLDEAERRAREMGARYVCLHVRRGNKGVANLYMRRGYVRAPEGDLDLPEVALDAYYLTLR